MKCFLITILACGLLAERNYRPPQQTNMTCDVGLMASYGLDWVRTPLKSKNIICPSIKRNCCTVHSQFLIYNKWVKSNLRSKLLRLYKTYIATYSLIFDDFKMVETMAESVSAQVPEDKQTSCGELAKRIISFQASKFKDPVVAAAKKAFKYVYTARRGFYCSLCDQRTHNNYRTRDGSIHFSYGFCGGLVKETMGWSVFKIKHFPKIARLYGHFLSACDANGNYIENEVLRDSLKFFKPKKLNQMVDTCVTKMKEDNGFSHCFGYCSQFNPVKFSEMFEGEFSKLLQFKVWMNGEIAEKFSSSDSGSSKKDLSFQGRVLQDKSATDAGSGAGSADGKTKKDSKGKKKSTAKKGGLWDSKYSRVNEFNNEIGAQILEPITYKPSENFASNSTLDFKSSIFPLGKTKVFDLADFRGVMDTNGMNFIKHGNALDLRRTTKRKLWKRVKEQRKQLIRNKRNPLSPNFGYDTSKIKTGN